MKGMYIGDNRVLISILGDVPLILPSNDLSLTPLLAVRGTVEAPLTQYFLANVKSGMIAIDVGANVGYFTVILGHLVTEAGRVYAYEANPHMYQFVLDNIHANYLKNHVFVLNRAVYSQATLLPFYVSERFPGFSSVHPFGAGHPENDQTHQIWVESDTLDERFGTLDRIDVVKIDAEGAEYQIMVGMKQLLEKGAIDTIAFEYSPHSMRQDAEPFAQLLRTLQTQYDYFLPQTNGSLQPLSLDVLLGVTFLHTVIMKKRR